MQVSQHLVTYANGSHRLILLLLFFKTKGSKCKKAVTKTIMMFTFRVGSSGKVTNYLWWIHVTLINTTLPVHAVR